METEKRGQIDKKKWKYNIENYKYAYKMDDK